MIESIADPRVCCDCGRTYQLTYTEQSFYLRKKEVDPDFNFPRRCKECRKAKKIQIKRPHYQPYND
jgi:hypothetical protein